MRRNPNFEEVGDIRRSDVLLLVHRWVIKSSFRIWFWYFERRSFLLS